VITVGNADIRNPHDGASGGDLGRLLVVDLSSLWAGPLCSHLLQQLGLRVVKVESTRRPDGARGGHRGFFDLLNGGKRSVALDFHADHDVALLRRLLSVADIVIEASRPRALEQLGIVATDLLAHGPRVWVSITGYGRSSPGRDWVAFGDDAAVAGGLVVRDPSGPCFCADAIADPLTGLTAALAALDALDTGRRVLLDIAMARVAGHFAGPTLPVTGDLRPSAPVARPVVQRGPELGEHNDIVLGPLRRRR
jgi:crotonobetainyl-CoA:carnitine CoA-transferase CaiB-like acyl-CoA transferase